MEEQKAQQDNRFLKGSQFAYMINDNFKISGTGEALLDLNDLRRVLMNNDNVQGFDTKWDEVLRSMAKNPMKMCWTMCTRSSSISSRGRNLSWLCICRIQSRKENRPVILD